MDSTNSRPSADRYVAIHDSTQFRTLRHKFRRFAVPASAVFVGWWFVTILFGAYGPGIYSANVVGSVNVGTLAVLVTLAIVVVIAAMYLKYARTELDPLAEDVRAEAEGGRR
jgi:uncharacterized membrane protein (DUF485 family)